MNQIKKLGIFHPFIWPVPLLRPSVTPMLYAAVGVYSGAEPLFTMTSFSALTKYFQFEDGTAGQIERFYDDVLASAALLQQRPLQSVFDDWITPFVRLSASPGFSTLNSGS